MKELEISCDQQKERTNTLSKCESTLRKGLMYKVRVMLSYFFSDRFSSSTLPVLEKNLNSRACPLGKQLSHFAHPRPLLACLF